MRRGNGIKGPSLFLVPIRFTFNLFASNRPTSFTHSQTSVLEKWTLSLLLHLPSLLLPSRKSRQLRCLLTRRAVAPQLVVVLLLRHTQTDYFYDRLSVSLRPSYLSLERVTHSSPPGRLKPYNDPLHQRFWSFNFFFCDGIPHYFINFDIRTSRVFWPGTLMVFCGMTAAVGQGAEEKTRICHWNGTLGFNNCNSTVFLHVFGIALDIPQVFYVE